jgi:serine/threonine protein phosphatase PrpC
MMQHAHSVVSADGAGQDRIKILAQGNRLIIAIADGAGGRSGGSEAAEFAVSMMTEQSANLFSQSDCESLLRAADAAIAADRSAGETTAVIVVVSHSELFGASVGDSGAWIVNRTEIDDLTAGQIRKPFLGTGTAHPVGFTRKSCSGTLLVATDGLLKYAAREKIARIIHATPMQDSPSSLVQLVRLCSGSTPDDVAVGLCRLE